MCTGRVDPLFILKAFEQGADGVILAGCHRGDCHYKEGNLKAEKRVHFLKGILKPIGFENRLEMHFISASEGIRFQEIFTQFTEKIKSLGPNPLKIDKPQEVKPYRDVQKRNQLHRLVISIANAMNFEPTEEIILSEDDVMEGYGSLQFDPEKCVGCGACYRNCPEDVIELKDVTDTRFINHFYFNCRTCNKCEEICPKDAVEVRPEFNLRLFLKEEPVKDITFELQQCSNCGTFFATELQLNDLQNEIFEGNKEKGLPGVEYPNEIFGLCPECKREIAASKMKSIYVLSR
jgi:coenzyme F420-reducing hydrogenase delta subunit/formate hydrogenlyase subunit 6/NADH:ubiquinone oxidoreductase subunit I